MRVSTFWSKILSPFLKYKTWTCVLPKAGTHLPGYTVWYSRSRLVGRFLVTVAYLCREYLQREPETCVGKSPWRRRSDLGRWVCRASASQLQQVSHITQPAELVLWLQYTFLWRLLGLRSLCKTINNYLTIWINGIIFSIMTERKDMEVRIGKFHTDT